MTKQEEAALIQELTELTDQLNKIAGGESVNADILETTVRTNLNENKQKIMVAFLDGEDVSTVYLNAANLNNADFIKRLMGG